MLVTATYVRDPAGRLRHVVLVARDTVARERQERSAAELVSTVAHELRSPLTSVKGFTATLLAKWERFTDEQKQHMLQTVNADADRVTRLISELLDVSRIESGRLELHKQVVDLPALVATGVRRPGRRRRAGRPLRLLTEGDVCRRCGPIRTSWSRSSATSSRTRCGTARAWSRVTVEPDGDGCAVDVGDEGEGIAEAVQR